MEHITWTHREGTDCDTSIDSLKVNEIKLTDILAIADKFNSYFTGIAQSLERNIPHATTSFEKYIGPTFNFVRIILV